MFLQAAAGFADYTKYYKEQTIMKNINIAHEFFYSDFNSHRNFNNISYNENLFYSYYTVIGAVVKSKFGNNILLVSENSMSSTTGRHIGNLINACPFSFLRVPMEYGNHYFSLEVCINRIVRNLDYYSESKLSLKANREAFIDSYNQLIYINDNIQDVDSSVIEQYRPLFELLSNSNKVKELKAKLKEKARQDRIKAEKELNELLNQYNYLDLIQFAYGYNSVIQVDDYSKAKIMQNKVKKALNPNSDLSFVWIEDDIVKTSKSITMSLNTVKAVLLLWNKNKVRHGYKIDGYTVLEIRENYVQIGCHKIPMDNIKALYDMIFNKVIRIKDVA